MRSILFFTLILTAASGRAAIDKNLMLGEDWLLRGSRLWISARGIVSAKPAAGGVLVKGLKEGVVDLRSGAETYLVRVVTPNARRTFTALVEATQSSAGLQVRWEDSTPVLSGRLYSAEEYFAVIDRLPNSAVWEFRAKVPERLKNKIEDGLIQRLGESAPLRPLLFDTAPTVLLNAKIETVDRWSKRLKKYGLVVRRDEEAVEMAPVVRVEIAVAEVRKDKLRGLGLRWPTSTEARLLPNGTLSSPDLIFGAQAFEQEGFGRLLARPNILCRSGREAEFIAGGELPIKIFNRRSQDVIWKRYGIVLKVRPKADASGRISLSMETEVSTIDGAHLVDGIPGLLTNKVASHFDLARPRTIALSGLIKNEDSKNHEGLFGLASLPIIGGLFSKPPVEREPHRVDHFCTAHDHERGRAVTDLEIVEELEMKIESLMDQQSEDTTGFRERRHRLLEERLSDIAEPSKTRILSEFEGHGPLQDLIADSEITEIILNGPSSIWLERKGRLQEAPTAFLSSRNYERIIEQLCLEAGAHRSVERPAADGSWRSFRVQAVRPPLSKVHSSLSLRRHPENPWTLDRLMVSGWCNDVERAMLRQLIKQRASFLVIGTTGAGKTSVTNALLAEAASERAVILEDIDEIAIPAGPSLKLLTRRDSQGLLPDVTLADLLRQSLRLRPDRLVVGEIRGGEAKDFLLALSTGHAGSFGTLHAENAAQALMRLEMLIQMGAPEWSTETVRRLIRLSLQYVVIAGKNERGERRFRGLHRLVSLEETGFLLEPVESIPAI